MSHSENRRQIGRIIQDIRGIRRR